MLGRRVYRSSGRCIAVRIRRELSRPEQESSCTSVVTEARGYLGRLIELCRGSLVRVDDRTRNMMAALDRVRASGGEARMDLAALIRQHQLIRGRREERMRERQALAVEREDSCVESGPERRSLDSSLEEQIG